MEKPLVSVIVTTKDEEKNIERFLESIKNQNYKNIEIVVVDNPKTIDKTREIARKYTKNIFLEGPERSAQRNLGAKKSKGKYLLFLDADMELTNSVVSECVNLAKTKNIKIITIPEATVGDGIIANIRKFEREMYMGDVNFEVSRFFEKDAFFEFGGYDLKLTGPEDYDLPYRMKIKYSSGRIKSYIYHHEEKSTLINLLKKKFYYAKKGATYAQKHPELIWVQGTILFRSVYFKNWKKFLRNPFVGVEFLIVRFLETLWALAGFLNAVGLTGMVKVVIKSLQK